MTCFGCFLPRPSSKAKSRRQCFTSAPLGRFRLQRRFSLALGILLRRVDMTSEMRKKSPWSSHCVFNTVKKYCVLHTTLLTKLFSHIMYACLSNFALEQREKETEGFSFRCISPSLLFSPPFIAYWKALPKAKAAHWDSPKDFKTKSWQVGVGKWNCVCENAILKLALWWEVLKIFCWCLWTSGDKKARNRVKGSKASHGHHFHLLANDGYSKFQGSVKLDQPYRTLENLNTATSFSTSILYTRCWAWYGAINKQTESWQVNNIILDFRNPEKKL